MTNRYKLVIGDWSCDGHNQSDEVFFITNKTSDEIRQAYLKAVKAIGVSLHHSDGDELKLPKDCIELFTEYESSIIPAEAKKRLLDAGVDWTKIKTEIYQDQETPYDGANDVATIFLEMVKTQFPDFEYKLEEDKTEPINGWWDKDFNVQIGYGIYH